MQGQKGNCLSLCYRYLWQMSKPETSFHPREGARVVFSSPPTGSTPEEAVDAAVKVLSLYCLDATTSRVKRDGYPRQRLAPKHSVFLYCKKWLHCGRPPFVLCSAYLYPDLIGRFFLYVNAVFHHDRDCSEQENISF